MHVPRSLTRTQERNRIKFLIAAFFRRWSYTAASRRKSQSLEYFRIEKSKRMSWFGAILRVFWVVDLWMKIATERMSNSISISRKPSNHHTNKNDDFNLIRPRQPHTFPSMWHKTFEKTSKWEWLTIHFVVAKPILNPPLLLLADIISRLQMRCWIWLMHHHRDGWNERRATAQPSKGTHMKDINAFRISLALRALFISVCFVLSVVGWNWAQVSYTVQPEIRSSSRMPMSIDTNIFFARFFFVLVSAIILLVNACCRMADFSGCAGIVDKINILPLRCGVCLYLFEVDFWHWQNKHKRESE